MLKINSYTLKGEKKGEIVLPKEFDVKLNLPLLAQAIRVYEERSHVGLRNTKTRSEVNRTTKKIYKQKGTGGARHGSRRANVFVGGGITFGPRPERRILTLTSALKSLAKMTAFVYKASEKSLIAVEGLSKIDKTKVAGEFLKKLSTELKANRFTFVIADKNAASRKFLRNLGNAVPISFKEVSAFDVARGGVVIMDADIFEKAADKAVKTVKKIAVKKQT